MSIDKDSSAGQHSGALDGVRGVAILAVILFHSLKLHCGWAGVQLFFVLSGYLITSILLRDSDLSLGFYLKRFYWRRSLRIFPLYFGYVLVLAIAYAIFKVPSVFGRDWPYLLTYTLNFRRILPDFGGSNPVYGRFWSLAIEEQFYLMWPLLLYCVPRKYFASLVAAILVVAPVCRALTPLVIAPIVPRDLMGAAIYYLTPGQLDTFATGAMIVLFGSRLRKRSMAIFIGSTLLLLVCGQVKALVLTGKPTFTTGFGYDVSMFQGFQHIWGYTLINIWAGALILVASSRNWISSLLAWSWLRYIGRISYGMYVYHQIILYGLLLTLGLAPMRTRLGFVFYFLCVVLVSDVSYRFYESRFLALKDTRFSRPKSRPDRIAVNEPLVDPV